MTVLRIALFGKMNVRCDGRGLPGLDTRKVQELFCYLLLFRDRPHPREVLANLLWADDAVDRPNRSLRKALWQIRNALDSEPEPLSRYVLTVEPDWIQINPEAELYLDVAAFEGAFNRVQGVRGRDLDPPAIQALQAAVDLYRGGLQESWYHDWYLTERERFQRMYLIVLDKLMEHCETGGQYELGLTYGAQILRCERAHERTHRRLMRLHYSSGERTAALRQYQGCVRALDEELGVEPSRRTVALYQQIQADQPLALLPSPAEPTSPPEVAASSLSGVLSRLKRLEALLANAQRQVHQDIERVEQMLSSRQ